MQAATRPKKHTTHDFAVQSIEEHVAAFYHSTKLQLFLVSANAADPSHRALITLAEQLEGWLAQQRGGKENRRTMSASINLPMGIRDSPDKPMLKQHNAKLANELRISRATIKSLLTGDTSSGSDAADDDAAAFNEGVEEFMTPHPSTTPPQLHAARARASGATLAASDDAARLRLRDVLIDQLRSQNQDLTARVEALMSSNAELRAQVASMARTRDSTSALLSNIKQLRAQNAALQQQVSQGVGGSQGGVGAGSGCVKGTVVQQQVKDRGLAAKEREGYRQKITILKQQLHTSQSALQEAHTNHAQLLEAMEGCNHTAEGLAQRAQRKSVKIQDLHRGLQGALQEVATVQGALQGLMEQLTATQTECGVLRGRVAAAEGRAVEVERVWEGRCGQLQGALAELKEAYMQVCAQEVEEEKNTTAGISVQGDTPPTEPAQPPRMAVNASALARLKRKLSLSSSSVEV